MSMDLEQILDRRLGDFEKVFTARLHSIQEAVNDTRSTMAVFVDKMSNLHKDYVPRSEHEKEQEQTNDKINKLQLETEKLEIKIEKLQAWRNYLAGAIGIMAFLLMFLSQATHVFGK